MLTDKHIRVASHVAAAMNPLFRADWRRIHTIFTAVMWVLVLVFVVCIIALTSATAAEPHHVKHIVLMR
jgi:preprotein translocase subunit SecG